MPPLPAVRCAACAREWHSRSMLEGLQILGHCPRCHGDLIFGSEDPASAEAAGRPQGEPVAPHMVLGIPRR